MRVNSIMDVVFSSESTTYPVTLAEAKAWAKIDLTDDDTLITELIKTATRQCEGFLGVSLLSRTVTVYLNNCAGDIELPYGPVTAFTSLSYWNGTTWVAFSATDYVLRGSQFKYIAFPWDDYLQAVYTTGFSSAPTVYKDAVLQQFTHLYENRGDNDQQGELSWMAKNTLSPYRRVV